ncbi:MAG TPA: S8 family serine peptidase [Symbiobacteriaceae bacterium]|nr:S8 family serine peptidase [Symbiobacteriaceae bacterium]
MKRSRMLLSLIVLFAVTLGSTVSANPGQEHARAHPALVKMAGERPDERVRVIVQAQRDQVLTERDMPAGASRGRDLAFINSRVLELPARAALQLASHPKVRFITPDSVTRLTAVVDGDLATTYPVTTGLQSSLRFGGWQGQGVGVAVLDSGISNHPDLWDSRVDVVVQGIDLGADDAYGHGTHIAGIIAGNSADGRYIGMAPRARVYNIKIADNQGLATESDLIAGLEWVYNNGRALNIRVVNISSQSGLAQSYHTAPLSAAVQMLWFKGIVVVVSAGNAGDAPGAMYYPPANDPFVITVGALNENGTTNRTDDTLAAFSSRGVTQDGFTKPDVLAPGHRIVSTMADGSYLGTARPDRIVDGSYLQLSGTSMAAPVVAGAVATLVGFRPTLKPDEVKWLVTNLTYGNLETGALDASQMYSHLRRVRPIGLANQGLTPHPWLQPRTSARTSSNVYFENVYFENVYIENVYFENVYFENVFFE